MSNEYQIQNFTIRIERNGAELATVCKSGALYQARHAGQMVANYHHDGFEVPYTLVIMVDDEVVATEQVDNYADVAEEIWREESRNG